MRPSIAQYIIGVLIIHYCRHQMSDEDFYEYPSAFESEDMRSLHEDQFNRFVDLRVRGIDRDTAFARTFPRYARPRDGVRAQERAMYLESTEWYQREFDDRLKKAKPSDLWNPNVSMNHLLAIIKSPAEKGSTKVAAARELNILAEITFVDAQGNTRAGGVSNELAAMLEERYPGYPLVTQLTALRHDLNLIGGENGTAH